MSLSIIHCRANNGIYAPAVTVETHISNGLPQFSIVGLPEKAVKESKERVRSALLNSCFEFPARRITVNLAPADLPKIGGRFDLPIALGILAASKQIPSHTLSNYEFAAELALTGELRPIYGVLPIALAAQSAKRSLVVCKANAEEASLAGEASIFPAKTLLEVCAHLAGKTPIKIHCGNFQAETANHYLDLADVHGQRHAKRSLEVAAAGGHSILFSGPPGTGKTMLASRLTGILPPISKEEALTVAAIHSISHLKFDTAHWQKRPFRAPHHSASMVALVGGGNPPRPGEISLAHNGVLFLDELPEFDRKVIESLREPLESGAITISRAARQAEFPANFQLVAAMNPCPCGHYGNNRGQCQCTPHEIIRYRGKLSGPVLDRIDIHVEVPPLPFNHLSTLHDEKNESTLEVRERVISARQRQLERSGTANFLLKNKELEQVCKISVSDQALLETAMEKLRLSTRSYHRILRIARTIADLSEAADIKTEHLQEAITYRKLEQAKLL